MWLKLVIYNVVFKNSTRDVPSQNMTSHGRRLSSGRPSLSGIQLSIQVPSSGSSTPKTSSYLSPLDARLEKSKTPPTSDASHDSLHNLISVSGLSGGGGVPEEARKAVEKCHLWEFDVIQLETTTNHR